MTTEQKTELIALRHRIAKAPGTYLLTVGEGNLITEYFNEYDNNSWHRIKPGFYGNIDLIEGCGPVPAIGKAVQWIEYGVFDMIWDGDYDGSKFSTGDGNINCKTSQCAFWRYATMPDELIDAVTNYKAEQDTLCRNCYNEEAAETASDGARLCRECFAELPLEAHCDRSSCSWS